jgi:hypothetical protein
MSCTPTLSIASLLVSGDPSSVFPFFVSLSPLPSLLSLSLSLPPSLSLPLSPSLSLSLPLSPSLPLSTPLYPSPSLSVSGSLDGGHADSHTHATHCNTRQWLNGRVTHFRQARLLCVVGCASAHPFSQVYFFFLKKAFFCYFCGVLSL